MKQWIDANERKPERLPGIYETCSDDVLVAYAGGTKMAVAFYDYHEPATWRESCSEGRICNVTHWAYLPASPAQQQEQTRWQPT